MALRIVRPRQPDRPSRLPGFLAMVWRGKVETKSVKLFLTLLSACSCAKMLNIYRYSDIVCLKPGRGGKAGPRQAPFAERGGGLPLL